MGYSKVATALHRETDDSLVVILENGKVLYGDWSADGTVHWQRRGEPVPGTEAAEGGSSPAVADL